MSATVEQIANALQTALETISGLRTAPYLSDNVTPPVALVAIETIDYHTAFRDAPSLHHFSIFLIIGRQSDRAGLKSLEAYMSSTGASSVKAAIEADQTLGGIAQTSIVTKAGPPMSLNINTAAYVSVHFEAEVYG